MKIYTYLSLIPEALILSQLPPKEFGNYLAVGSHNRARGQAFFFEVDPDFRSDVFRIDEARARCVPHPDGAPKRSAYISIYKVLENVPLEALRSMYLATSDGRVLEVSSVPYPEKVEELPLRLYQEICPVHSMVASRLAPREFGKLLTTPEQPLRIPTVAFCELNLGELARDPANGSAENLPYRQIDHVRDCLAVLRESEGKKTKTVVRDLPHGILYRTVTSGFYVANGKGILYYPMPSRQELETEHYYWWHSARMEFTS